MIAFDNGRVKAMTQCGDVCIMTEDWQRIYITYEELASIAEAVESAAEPFFTEEDEVS